MFESGTVKCLNPSVRHVEAQRRTERPIIIQSNKLTQGWTDTETDSMMKKNMTVFNGQKNFIKRKSDAH